ncbi:MAG TPA: adenylate/guanylate cyclase domain-containing protein, partial [bacterium]|nr:adenylate/guanylate cyclase domain-containing protein [bacterium]
MVESGFKECPYCFEVIREKAKVCRFCHAVLTEEPIEPVFVTPSKAALEHERALEDLPSSQLTREEILNKEQENGIRQILKNAPDEYRMATVLFADLCGYTRVSSEVSAEEMKGYLDAFYDQSIHAVSVYNGFVVKFVGDGILAVFGAPVAYDRDAESAVRAALEIRDQVSAMPSINGKHLRVKVGIHTGEILSTVVTARGRQATFDIFGDAVNIACRLQSVAKDGQILVSGQTFDLVRHAFELGNK